MWEAPQQRDDGPTVARATRRALSETDALKYIAGEDRRPLLVLRECKVCNGTDDALLSRGNVDNERTFLLSRWFHCVKLPVDVLESDHPFRSLFRADDAEHMFLCAADGSNKIPLESERSRVELWDAMTFVLRATYDKAPEAEVRKMQRTIEEIDLVDERIVAGERRVDMYLETDGADSPKLKKAKRELEAALKQREELIATIAAATAQLRLKETPDSKPQDAPKRS